MLSFSLFMQLNYNINQHVAPQHFPGIKKRLLTFIQILSFMIYQQFLAQFSDVCAAPLHNIHMPALQVTLCQYAFLRASCLLESSY
jgi:hypothetical protein